MPLARLHEFENLNQYSDCKFAYSQELLQEVIQVILSSSLNSKKCWVAPLSELRDLVKSFASFLNFPFQSEDSLRRKIFTYTAYSYECLLNVFAHLKPHLLFNFYLQNLLTYNLLTFLYILIALLASAIFWYFTCCQVKESFPCESKDYNVGNLERHFCEFDIYFSDSNIFNIFRILPCNLHQINMFQFELY